MITDDLLEEAGVGALGHDQLLVQHVQHT
jgi:hypothetical protein